VFCFGETSQQKRVLLWRNKSTKTHLIGPKGERLVRTVEASRGFEWWKSGFETVFKAPAVFLVMGLAWGIPILNIIAILLNPALQAGVQQAARKLDGGQMPEIGDLFSGLQSKAGPLIILCLIPIALLIVLLILAFILAGGAILAAIGSASGGNGQPNPAALAGLLGSMGLVFLIAIPLGLAVFAAMFFAVSRIMFDNIGAIDALKESFAASIKNIGAMLVFIACAIAIGIAGTLLAIIPIVGPIIFATVLYPVIAVAAYRAYLDVFQPVLGFSGQMPAPPPPPGAPGW